MVALTDAIASMALIMACHHTHADFLRSETSGVNSRR